MMREDRHWKLDRRIPIAVIITLLMQMLGAIVWATSIDARVYQIETHSVGEVLVNEKFARMEERLEYLRESVNIIRRQLEGVNQQRHEK